jgi:death-on-curing protein
MEPFFLTLEEVRNIHREQISLFGGALGIRDLALLQSALAQPSATFGGNYLHHDIYEMAAAYLFHLVQNHPFLDGNKRVGLETALTFLALNGIEIEANDELLYSIVIAVAGGTCGKPVIADFLRKTTEA